MARYCVRPNSGRIEPGNTVEIQGTYPSPRTGPSPVLIIFAVLLQAMKEDPPLDARCRDKFLVQSVAILPDQELGNVTSIVCFLHILPTLTWNAIINVATGRKYNRPLFPLSPAVLVGKAQTNHNLSGKTSKRPPKAASKSARSVSPSSQHTALQLHRIPPQASWSTAHHLPLSTTMLHHQLTGPHPLPRTAHRSPLRAKFNNSKPRTSKAKPPPQSRMSPTPSPTQPAPHRKRYSSNLMRRARQSGIYRGKQKRV